MARKGEVDGRNETRDKQRTDGEIIKKHCHVIESFRDTTREVVNRAEDEDHEICNDENQKQGAMMPHCADNSRVQVD